MPADHPRLVVREPEAAGTTFDELAVNPAVVAVR